MGPELRLLNLHFFNICRHHPTLKFKPHATDDEGYVSGIDGVPLIVFLTGSMFCSILLSLVLVLVVVISLFPLAQLVRLLVVIIVWVF